MPRESAIEASIRQMAEALTPEKRARAQQMIKSAQGPAALGMMRGALEDAGLSPQESGPGLAAYLTSLIQRPDP